MSLALSSQAVPELTLPALDQACRERGLDGEELVISTEGELEGLGTSRARIVALRAQSLDVALAPALARASAKLQVPVSVPAGAIAPDALPAIAREFSRMGGRLLLAEGGSFEALRALRARIRALDAGGDVGIAWEVRPSDGGLEEAARILPEIREVLGLVRLHGGGPEQREQDGMGVGGLLATLALSRYPGAIVLCPSRPETLPKWSAWLASRRSTGCGSKAPLGTSVELDVRPVEPRDRLDTILGAYHSLPKGGTLRLTVDHDPSCMYYTLQATEPEGSFSFRKLEDGPEVWRAEVTRS